MTGCGRTTEPGPRRVHVLRASGWGLCSPGPLGGLTPSDAFSGPALCPPKRGPSGELAEIPGALPASASSAQPHRYC